MSHSVIYKQIMNSREWRQMRDRKRAANPLCEDCLANGIVEPMREVHHINDIENAKTDREAWQLALLWSNLRSLCHACHRAYHSKTKIQQHKERQQDRLDRWKREMEGGPASF